MSENRAQNRVTENKVERVPVDGMRDIMTVRGRDPAYEYRWVADSDEKGSRIWKFKRGGWDLVKLDEEEAKLTIGQESVYKSKEDGTLCRLHTGDGAYSYLMRIKKEWYDEDQDNKAASIRETEAGIIGEQSSQGEANNGQYGSVKFEK